MKLFIFFSLILLQTFELFSQTYCIPPKYYSGPYTGITKVSIGTLSKSSVYNDGYSDFTATAGTFILKKGSNDTISIDIYYDRAMLSYFAGNVNVRVWIDWNQNKVFDEAYETMLANVQNCSANLTTQFKASFVVPATAKLGSTRMRVFEDMVETDGHDTPKPCGYLNSTNQLGQHGECEDYQIQVIEGTDVVDNSENSSLIYPNPVTNYLNIKASNYLARIEIFSVFGLKVLETEWLEKIDVSSLSSGIYFLNINYGKTTETKSFIIMR